MNDLLNVSYDFNPPDEPAMIISRVSGESIYILNEFVGADAIGIHDLLTGHQGHIVPQGHTEDKE